MLRTFALAFAVLMGAQSHALAASVFLNGVNINGVKNQEFKGCDVKIDEKGNIYITKKGLRVKGGERVATGEITNPGGPTTRRYFLVTEKAAPGMSQYDIELYVNSKWVRKLLDAEEHIYLEITKYLVQGENKIRFIARKNLDGGRRSQSPNHYFRVVVGEGDMGGRNVMITRKLVDYKRNASETQNLTNEFTVTAY